MTLTDVMEKTSHRQYLLWMEWLDQQWNKPTRTDWYLIQLTAELRRGFTRAKNILLDPWKINFSRKKKTEPKKLTAEEIAKRDKALLFPGIDWNKK